MSEQTPRPLLVRIVGILSPLVALWCAAIGTLLWVVAVGVGVVPPLLGDQGPTAKQVNEWRTWIAIAALLMTQVALALLLAVATTALWRRRSSGRSLHRYWAVAEWLIVLAVTIAFFRLDDRDRAGNIRPWTDRARTVLLLAPGLFHGLFVLWTMSRPEVRAYFQPAKDASAAE